MDFHEIILSITWSYYLLIFCGLFSLFTIIFLFIKKKKGNILKYISLLLIILTCIITTIGDESAYITFCDYLDSYLNDGLLFSIVLLFFFIFFFIIISNCFIIFKNGLSIKKCKIILSISSFLLAIQLYFVRLLEPDFLYLTEEIYDSESEILAEYASNNILVLIVGLIIAILFSTYILSLKIKKNTSK